MDLYDFYSAIVDGVAGDADLAAWAVANFGKAVTVHAGLPADSFPDMESDTPFVAFAEPFRQCSQNRRTIVYGVGAWMGLSDKDTDVLAPDGEVRPTGIQLILDGMRLVRLAVIAAMPAGVALDDFEEHADVNAVGAEVNGDMGFVFVQPVLIGQNPME